MNPLLQVKEFGLGKAKPVSPARIGEPTLVNSSITKINLEEMHEDSAEEDDY